MENLNSTHLAWSQDENQPASELYLELLKRVLIGVVRPKQLIPADIPEPVKAVPGYEILKNELESHGLLIAERLKRDIKERIEGSEWIPDGETMIGMFRLNNIHDCVRTVIADKIPGDLLEAGVWRGGACILMRACLKAYGDNHRNVWVADSFRGLPPPSPESYPADVGDLHHTYEQLAISQEVVKENFRLYGMLDDRVKFLEGWFKDTLPTAPIDKLAVLRLDGDMYESTMDTLNGLYHKLSVGGFAIVDDYHWHKPCAQATDDFRAKHGITEPIIQIDRLGAFWRRER